MAWPASRGNSQSQTQTQTQTESQSQSEHGGATSDRATSKEKGKFDHLLNPGKNLAQSWGVDVAKELSEYAMSLGITFDCEIEPLLDEEEGMRVDFAEAALMLQGSTTIYCRKVEHLYSLVLAAVEVVNQVKSRSTRSGGNGTAEGDDDDDDSNSVWDTDDIDFLNLDDVFPVAESSKILRNEQEHIASARKVNDPTKLVEVPPLLRQPTNRDSDSSGNNVLRMDFGTVDESGAMLLHGALESSFGKRRFALSSQGRMSLDRPDPLRNDFGNGISAESPEVLRHDCSPGDSPGGGDDNDLPPFHDEVPPLMLDEHPQTRTPQLLTARRESIQERVDPHKELNPHDDAGIRVRPIRASRLANANYRPKRTKCQKSLYSVLADIDDDDADITDILGVGRKRGRQVCFQGLREQAKTMRRKVASLRRHLYKDSQGAYSFADEAQAINANGNVWDEDGDHGDFDDDLGVFDNGDDDSDGGPILSLGLDDDNVPLVDASAFSLGDNLGLREIVSGYQEACLQYVEQTAMLWEKKEVNADLIERVEKWSARIRPKLEEEGNRPVFDIHESGDQVLRQAQLVEEHKSRSGMKQMEAHEVTMKEAFQATKQYEVCRLFLATLQLANNYDVEICENEDKEPALKLLDSTRVTEIRSMPLGELKENVPGGSVKRLKSNRMYSRAPQQQQLG